MICFVYSVRIVISLEFMSFSNGFDVSVLLKEKFFSLNSSSSNESQVVHALPTRTLLSRLAYSYIRQSFWDSFFAIYHRSISNKIQSIFYIDNNIWYQLFLIKSYWIYSLLILILLQSHIDQTNNNIRFVNKQYHHNNLK